MSVIYLVAVLNNIFFHKNPEVPMVHSIKNGCKNGKSLRDKIAIIMHMHTHFCDSFYLYRICQN